MNTTVKEKKCKVCKKPFMPVRSTLQSVCSPGCANFKAIDDRKYQKPKVKKRISFGRKEINNYTKSQVKKDLDVIFMAWTRMRTADGNGIVTCISSNRPYHWSKVDAGHFLPRSVAPGLIFHPDNVWPQSKIDNWFEGNRIQYRANLVKKIGKGKVELLEAMQGKKSGIGLFEMKVMLWDYIEKFKAECQRLNHTPNTRQQVVLNRWDTIKKPES